MSKHTPGPWFHDLYSDDNQFQVYDQNYKPIATITGQKGAYEANARLLSAAPDLLDACKDLARELEVWIAYAAKEGTVPHVRANILLTEARAAIAKAEPS